MKSINNMKNIKNEIITFVNSISEDKKNQENKCIDTEDQLDSISKQFDYFLNENKVQKNEIEKLESKISTLET